MFLETQLSGASLRRYPPNELWSPFARESSLAVIVTLDIIPEVVAEWGEVNPKAGINHERQ